MHGDDETIHKVIVNHEEQYSVQPMGRENPLGWRDAGKSGTKAECLAWLEQVWSDMRPSSLRQRMQVKGDNNKGDDNKGDGGS